MLPDLIDTPLLLHTPHRWTLTARLPRKAGFDEDDPQERPPGKGRFMLTRSTGFPGDPPNKLRGLLDIPIPEVGVCICCLLPYARMSVLPIEASTRHSDSGLRQS